MRSTFIGFIIITITASLVGCAAAQPFPVVDATEPAVSPRADPTPSLTSGPIPTIDPQTCDEQTCVFEGHFLLENPIPSGANQTITRNYPFGSTLEGEREIHHGVEFDNPFGTPVLAAADGTVVFAGVDVETDFGLNTNFYGKLVIVEHRLTGIAQPVYTLYAHLSEVSVLGGDAVKAGMQIGKVGRTGAAQGSHLHFEVRLGRNTYAAAVNPELWLTLTPEDASGARGALAGVFLDPEGERVCVTNIQLEYSSQPGGAPENHLATATYYNDSLAWDPLYNENFVISQLTPGWYRLVAIARGAYLSKWVQVEPGKLIFLYIPLP
jgi:hypothetical protein